MFGSMIRYFSTKPKPKMKPIELKTSPEQTQTISREVGLRGLTSKRHMKIVLRWMRGRQNIRLICNHVGPHKQFLHARAVHNSSTSTTSFSVDTSSPKSSSG
ncbi:hypothetical protein ES332_D12G323900v1 [Gossypium tomentosum]|uniref:Uncharacterized protein n=1 Tax=Gossypium tomentosum TaxID=34277 RepID=A0A5D2IHY4_GOSTO|nr:hypothetical protein ES332_D12G323900v1 [Gossypium tomentosum]